MLLGGVEPILYCSVVEHVLMLLHGGACFVLIEVHLMLAGGKPILCWCCGECSLVYLTCLLGLNLVNGAGGLPLLFTGR